MIINRVPQLLRRKFGEERVNLSRVQEETGLSYSTVHRWATDKVDRADFPMLEIWCDYFDCNVGDILERVKDKPDK